MPDPKSCVICDQPATVFVSFVRQGVLTKTAYCQHHAEQEGVLDDHAYNLLPQDAGATVEPLDSSPKCPGCGCSQRDFERSGRVGCALCYESFADAIQPMLRRMHRDEKHLGKVPSQRLSSDLLQQRMAKAKEELEEAVRDEHYEAAARLRDEINDMQSQLTRMESSTAQN
ncbi:MAG: UvrB/UvrC motif-containing protein [Opitutales bacterium]